jgi:hypothetical protein
MLCIGSYRCSFFNQQVTYLKQLDGTVRYNFQAIAHLSDTLKNLTMKAQKGFQDVAAKLAWCNTWSAQVLRTPNFFSREWKQIEM